MGQKRYLCEKATTTIMLIGDIRRIALFAEASDEALDELLRYAPGRVRTYDTGELIAMQGARVKSLLVLTRGSVRAQMISPEGKRLTMDELTAPDLLAAAFVYCTDNKFPVSVEATTPVEIWSIDREYLLGFMGRHTAVMRRFLQIISDRSHFLSQKISALTLQSLRDRLLGYMRTHGTIGKQEDLALMLGVARPSLARLLSELVEEGVLRKDARGYSLASTMIDKANR